LIVGSFTAAMTSVRLNQDLLQVVERLCVSVGAHAL
jgi:hypothetical protein